MAAVPANASFSALHALHSWLDRDVHRRHWSFAAVQASHMPERASHHDTSAILADLVQGDASATDRLLPLVYAELRALAGACMRDKPLGHTLQPTALVHEAYLRLVGGDDAFANRAHFMAVAAKVMRGILVDHARKDAALKNGGGWKRITLSEAATLSGGDEIDTLALDEVLSRLAQWDARKARVAEMRFYGGLSLEQVAEAIGMARSTVAEDWRMARAWLAKELLEPEGAA
jgi:RNA polymerase sigma factor (TIGR02999 family)